MNNVWTQFQKLVGKDVTQVATVTNTDGETSTVELLSGDPLRVIGTAEVGTKVYIKGGEIIQTAGDLEQFNMILY